MKRSQLDSAHLAGLLVVLMLGVGLCWINRPWLRTWVAEATLPAARATYNLNDYAAFANAARMIVAGEGPVLYQISAQRAQEARAWGARFDQALAVPFVNPPWLAMALVPLAVLPLGVGFLIWLALCTALVFGATILLARWARPPPLVAATFILVPIGFVPFWRTAILGQTSALVLFGLTVGIVSVAQGRASRAGLALALAGVKPQLLILPLLALAAERRWRPLGWCVAASGALLAAGLLITGPGAVPDYLQLISSAAYASYENLPQMQTWRALVEGTLGLTGGPAAVLNGLGLLVALAVIAWAWRPAWTAGAGRNPAPPAGRVPADPEWDLRMALTLLLTQMITPHLHIHDLLIWLVPGGLVLHHLYAPGARARLGRQWAGGVACLWAGYLVVWPAWLLPDARLALVFSLVAAGWMIAVIRSSRQAQTAPWVQWAITP